MSSVFKRVLLVVGCLVAAWGTLMLGGVLFALLGVSGEWLGVGTSRTADAGGAKEASRELLSVTASELVSAYAQNEVAADKRFAGQRIRVSGRIDSIGKTFGEAYLTLGTLSGMPVKCVFDNEDALVPLRRGQTLLVEGDADGLTGTSDIGVVILGACAVPATEDVAAQKVVPAGPPMDDEALGLYRQIDDARRDFCASWSDKMRSDADRRSAEARFVQAMQEVTGKLGFLEAADERRRQDEVQESALVSMYLRALTWNIHDDTRCAPREINPATGGSWITVQGNLVPREQVVQSCGIPAKLSLTHVRACIGKLGDAADVAATTRDEPEAGRSTPATGPSPVPQGPLTLGLQPEVAERTENGIAPPTMEMPSMLPGTLGDGMLGGASGRLPDRAPPSIPEQSRRIEQPRPARPTLTRHVKPVYPKIAQSAGVEGTVVVEARVLPNGRVTAVRVIRSIPMLDQAAIDAVKQWEYTQTMVDGRAVEVLITVDVNFTLR